jgi:hypothetical protein
MKRTLLTFIAPVLLSAFIAGCSAHKDGNPQPAAKAISADMVNSWGMYTNGGSSYQPEYMDEVAAKYRGRYSSGNYNFTGNDLLALGRTTVPGGKKIWYFYQPQCLCSATFGPYNLGNWYVVAGPNGGGAVHVAEANGYWYVIDDQNRLWSAAFIGPGPNPVWTLLPYQATDIAGYGPYVYFLDATPVGGGHRIFRLTGNGASSSATEVWPGSGATKVAVDYTGRPWIVNSLTEIFVGPTPGVNGGFTLVPGNATDIASTGEYIGIIGTNAAYGGSNIYTRYISYPNSYPWTLEPGAATQINASTNEYGSFFITNSIGEIFKGM